MRYLITGTTGFKGSWLALWLTMGGHSVYGLSLPPNKKSHFNLLGLEKNLTENIYIDIRDKINVENYIKRVKPDVIFHLAAQSLVTHSYDYPRETFETNVIGTFNILEAATRADSTVGIVVVTTDKVYKNKEKNTGYIELDELGGHDPYSASKAMADLMVQSWFNSFGSTPPIAIVRAGNVVAGGDFAKDRIIPDIFNSIKSKQPLKVRHLNAVRPWQHVLDCLNGYKMAADYVVKQGKSDIWNFSPNDTEIKSVSDVLNVFQEKYNGELQWEVQQSTNFHETKNLLLNSKKAFIDLGWSNKLQFQSTLDLVDQWYTQYYNNNDVRNVSSLQIDYFESLSYPRSEGS